MCLNGNTHKTKLCVGEDVVSRGSLTLTPFSPKNDDRVFANLVFMATL